MRRSARRALVGATLGLLLLVSAPAASGQNLNANLIENPGAEAGVPVGCCGVSIPPWQAQEGFGGLRYGTTNQVRPVGVGGTFGFVSSGSVAPSVTATQGPPQNPRLAVTEPTLIAQIDRGEIEARLSALLGRYGGETDGARVYVLALRADGTEISPAPGFLSVEERAWAIPPSQGFVSRAATARVPPGTRALRVVMESIHAPPTDGTNNNASFDDLDLRLLRQGTAAPPATGPQQPGPAPPLDGGRCTIGQNPLTLRAGPASLNIGRTFVRRALLDAGCLRVRVTLEEPAYLYVDFAWGREGPEFKTPLCRRRGRPARCPAGSQLIDFRNPAREAARKDGPFKVGLAYKVTSADRGYVVRRLTLVGDPPEGRGRDGRRRGDDAIR